jgi:hypothetical protein
MIFKVKNVGERSDNKVQLGKVFYGANLGNIETIVSVKKKMSHSFIPVDNRLLTL